MFSRYLNLSFGNLNNDLLQVRKCIMDISKNFICYEKIFPFLTKGKFLRSILSLKIAYKYTNHLPDDIYRFLAIVELIHLSSLLHDDVIDNNFVRRGIPTINKVHGNKLSILIGDYIMAQICKLLSGELILHKFIETCSKMVTGAYLEQQLQLTDNFDLYIEGILCKTGSLFELAGYIVHYLLNLSNVYIPTINKTIDNINFPYKPNSKTKDPSNIIGTNINMAGINIVKNIGNNIRNINIKDISTNRAINDQLLCLYYGIIFQVQDDINEYTCKEWTKSEDYVQSHITFPILLLEDKSLFVRKSQANFDKIKRFIRSQLFIKISYEKLNKYTSFIDAYNLN